ncbi:unnamed protein product [Candidula unifasciata]|uniref:Methyltransferase domain-containing protein n=1 Tax=Candidula unifasciata TaxID=100452 RepID=A0A8S3ZVW8_9EUPU|nr:unnamed protein product [Candidula unifasciata]
MTSFADKLGSVVTSTYVGFALSLCKDVGILEVLMDAEMPLTSQEIADKKDLKERYVRELLGSLATAEVVHVSKNESGALVYHLDEDEKALLKTLMMALISGPSVMSPQFDTVKSCLPSKGPTGGKFTNRTHDYIEEFTTNLLNQYVEAVLKHVPGLKEKLERGIEVLEVGCGRGRLLAKFALMFPKSTFTASDYADFLLDQLKTNLGHIPNIKYALIDVCCPRNLPKKKYDWVYCANTIHDVPNPPEALKNIKKLLKAPDDTFTMFEIATSGSPMADKGNQLVACLYAISSFMCVPESYTNKDSYAMGMCFGNKEQLTC